MQNAYCSTRLSIFKNCRSLTQHRLVGIFLFASLLAAMGLSPADAYAQPSASDVQSNVSHITATGARINYVPSNWFYNSLQRKAPTSGGCQSTGHGDYVTLTGLTPNTDYEYWVYAGNGSCATTPSKLTFTTLSGLPPAPTKPVEHIAPISPGYAHFKWTISGNGGSDFTNWQYRKKVGNNEWETTWNDACAQPNSSICKDRRSVQVPNLVGGIPHKFKVRGVNANGNGPESPASDAIMIGGSTTLAASNRALTSVTLELSGYSGAW